MLFFVPTPIGNLADISLHALEVLSRCSLILCEDTRVTKKLLTLLLRNPQIQQAFPNIAPQHKRFISFHSHNQDSMLATFEAEFFTQDIAFCTDAGMPSISDPGALLLRYARQHNIQYEVLLGGSAFSHAFVHSGLEGDFCFAGFLPHKQLARQERLKELQDYHRTLHIIVYESPKRLLESLQDIALILPCANLFVYKELTKMYEQNFFGTAAQILAALPQVIRGEYCIIIQKDSQKREGKLPQSEQILRLTQEDIIALDMHPKQKAKLLAKISDKSIKEWYQELTR